MSLRRRLTAGLLALTALVIGALFVLTFLALRSFLISRLDEPIRSPPAAFVRLVCEDPTQAPAPAPPLTVHVVRVTADGTTLPPCRETATLKSLSLAPGDAVRILQAGGSPVEVTSGDLRFRAVAVRDGGQYWVVARPLADVEAILRQLILIEVVLGAAALAATAVIGALAVRWGLRPLQQITGTARAVADDVARGSGGLDRRVTQGGSGTEVGQLASAFNQMLDAVQVEVAAREDSEQRMRQFLADVSHELRTPLTTLRGYAELLRMRAQREGRDAGDWYDALWRVESEGTRMARLVDDLLVLARADEDDHPDPEPVHLDRLARDAVADLRAVHPHRTVSLHAERGCVVPGHPDRLRQVMANLLTNAAVHTRSTAAIRVTVRARARRVALVVDDDGPGLTPREAAHVFDRFWRADTGRSRARGGTGLGLPIVDALVTAHGGTLRFDSSPAGGTTVHIELPRWVPGPAGGADDAGDADDTDTARLPTGPPG